MKIRIIIKFTFYINKVLLSKRASNLFIIIDICQRPIKIVAGYYQTLTFFIIINK